MRRLVLVLPLALAVVTLAACGGGESVAPAPETVEGAMPVSEEAGKSLFAAQGCGACHTFTPAGSNAQVGPNLDQLAKFAQQADQPVEGFTRRSLTDPNDYVEQGFQPGVMPAYDKLSDDDLNALVEFLTQPPA